MLLLLFDDINFHKLAQTEDKINILRDVYNVFQWIFCNRFMEEDLMNSFNSPNVIHKIDIDIMNNTISAYRGANLKITILTIHKYAFLRENFLLYNSYEKISWEVFMAVIKLIIPNFDTLQFGILMEKFFQKDDSPLASRLLFDFHNTHEWFEYLSNQMNRHRTNFTREN